MAGRICYLIREREGMQDDGRKMAGNMLRCQRALSSIKDTAACINTENLRVQQVPASSHLYPNMFVEF